MSHLTKEIAGFEIMVYRIYFPICVERSWNQNESPSRETLRRGFCARDKVNTGPAFASWFELDSYRGDRDFESTSGV